MSRGALPMLELAAPTVVAMVHARGRAHVEQGREVLPGHQVEVQEDKLAVRQLQGLDLAEDLAVQDSFNAEAAVAAAMARGHRIGDVAEFPAVVSDGLESVQKTKVALETLKVLGCGEELQRVIDSKKVRAGKGKMRNRRYVMRRGPLVVYNEDNGIVRAMRNIPGVETACVDRLNLLKLAPGGHVGRLCVWSKSAFESLQGRFSGKSLPKVLMMRDLQSLINDDAIQAVINPQKSTSKVPRKRNLLASKKSRFETFRGFSLEEVAARKRKAESMDGKARKKFRQA